MAHTVEINGNYSQEISWKNAQLNKENDKNAMQTLDQSSIQRHRSDGEGEGCKGQSVC